MIGRTLAVVAFLGAPAPAPAQSAVQTVALSFGAFVAGTGGTVIQDRNSARAKTGGVLLVPQGPGTASRFSVSGVGMLTYSIVLPESAVLSDGKGHTMMASQFLSLPSGTGSLSMGGTGAFTVGATLAVGRAQAPGIYQGTFPVTLTYN
jgi:hypothetical protein